MSPKDGSKSVDKSVKVAVITGCATILAAGVTGLLAFLATSAGSSKVSSLPSPTASSAITSMPSPKLIACKGLAGSLTKEIDAALAVNANVTEHDGRPVSINRSAFESAASRETMTNQAAQTALSTYSSTGLKVPTDQNVMVILSDIDPFIARLPDEMNQARTSNASEDWGALQDRPNVLRKKVVPAVEKQCTTL